MKPNYPEDKRNPCLRCSVHVFASPCAFMYYTLGQIPGKCFSERGNLGSSRSVILAAVMVCSNGARSEPPPSAPRGFAWSEVVWSKGSHFVWLSRAAELPLGTGEQGRKDPLVIWTLSEGDGRNGSRKASGHQFKFVLSQPHQRML